MTVDTQKLGLEACRRWAEVAGLSDDDWRSRAAFVSGYEIGHREALEQGIVQEMLEVLEDLEWSAMPRGHGNFCPSCQRQDAEENGPGHASDCSLASLLARIRREEDTGG